MNYIKQLQAENEQLRQRLAAGIVELDEFKVHLHSDKFKGEEGGERKDWIATADVLHRLSDVRATLNGMA